MRGGRAQRVETADSRACVGASRAPAARALGVLALPFVRKLSLASQSSRTVWAARSTRPHRHRLRTRAGPTTKPRRLRSRKMSFIIGLPRYPASRPDRRRILERASGAGAAGSSNVGNALWAKGIS